MIEVKSVIKTFDDFKALNKLDMNVVKGSIYGLVGPNGAGKTTILKHLSGVYIQDSGSIKINDEEVYENIDVKSKIGFIQDDLFYFDQYTIKDMMEFYKGMYKETFSDEKFESMKNVFKIDVKRKIKTLSKGMKKQVAFWLVMSCMPELIILDEPLDGLDPIIRRSVIKLLLKEVNERKITAIISSHNLRELEDICDTVGFMKNGAMVLERKLDELSNSISKVQVAFSNDTDIKLSKNFKIISSEKIGKVNRLIIKGDKEKVEAEIMKLKPLLLDTLPLTLEEIFIYELGGENNEVNEFFN